MTSPVARLRDFSVCPGAFVYICACVYVCLCVCVYDARKPFDYFGALISPCTADESTRQVSSRRRDVVNSSRTRGVT